MHASLQAAHGFKEAYLRAGQGAFVFVFISVAREDTEGGLHSRRRHRQTNPAYLTAACTRLAWHKQKMPLQQRRNTKGMGARRWVLWRCRRHEP